MADLLPVHGLLDGSVVTNYFRTSDVYGESGGLGQKVNIRKIAPDDLLGTETIVPVKELLRVGKLLRIGIRYQSDKSRRKSARVLVGVGAIPDIFGLLPTERLEGVEYKIGTDTAKGNITAIGMIRRATTY